MVSERPSAFYLPPEWAPQTAVWLSWPTNPALWPGRQEVIPAFFARFAAAISKFETVRINAEQSRHAEILSLIEEAGGRRNCVELFDYRTDDVWCRDHGPLFLKDAETGEVAVSDWVFNAWGEKFSPFDRDDAVPRQIARWLGMKCFSHPQVLEGGAVEVNGARQLLTTESVLLNPNRKLPESKPLIEDILKKGLGVDEVFWLGEGLDGDDTDGHIDNLARFVSNDTILAATAEPSSPSYVALRDNWRRLESLRTKKGKPFNLIALPLPPLPVIAPADNRVLPASYVNYLLVNGAVLAPQYGQPADALALEILAKAFPDRRILGIDCRDVLIEGGALHCLSQQQPR